MLKLHILEKAMQAVTAISKCAQTVKDKIHKVAKQVENTCQKVKEKLIQEKNASKEASMKLNEIVLEQAAKKGTSSKMVTYYKSTVDKEFYKENSYRHLKVYKKESNVIYLAGAFEKQHPAFKGREDVYIDLIGIHSREPTLKVIIT